MLKFWFISAAISGFLSVGLGAFGAHSLKKVLDEYGKSILASNIPANRRPVLGDHGDLPAGLLYDLHSPNHFLRQALRLIDDRELRKKLGQGGIDQAARMPGPEEEPRGLLRVYEKVLRKPRTCYKSTGVLPKSEEVKKREQDQER